MILHRKKFAAFSALTLVFLTAAIAANAQIMLPAPGSAQGQFRVFELPTPSFLGVQTDNISRENFSKYNLSEPRGVAVTAVIANSPAKQAGLQKGDVIVRFDGEEVKSVAKLMRMIEEVAPDQKAKLTVVRGGGNEQEIVVTMGKRPVPPNDSLNTMSRLPNFESGNGIPPRPELPGDFQGYGIRNQANSSNNSVSPEHTASGRKLGASVSLLTTQLGDYFGAPAGYGVLVHQVDENGNSARAGLKAGDVIMEVDGEIIASPRDLTRILNKKIEGDFAVTILRNKQRQTIRIKAEPEN